MAAMADSANSAQREFGARCLGEFIRYAIKQAQNPNRSPLALSSLLSRMYSLASHPGPMQRLGFAFALNSTDVYRELREDPRTLDIHLFELVQHAFLALRLAEADPPDLGTCESLESVIVRLRKIMVRDIVLEPLNEPNERRTAFKEGFRTFAPWLFEQCMQPHAAARRCASDFFHELCPRLYRVQRRPMVSTHGVHVEDGGSRTWVLDQYGTRLSSLPIVRLFTPVSADMQRIAVSDMELDDPLGGGHESLTSLHEGCFLPGAWAALAQSAPLVCSAESSWQAGGDRGIAPLRWLWHQRR